MLRNVAAIAAGIVTAFATVMLIDKVGNMVYPLPPGLDLSDPGSARDYFATMDVGQLLLLVAAWMVGSFVGILLACYIGTAGAPLLGAVVGGVVLARSIATLIADSYPLWLSLAMLAGIAASALLAVRLAPPSTRKSLELFDDDGNSG